MLELAPVLRSMAAGALETDGKVRPARILACDAIADLLESGRQNLQNLATEIGGPLAPQVEYLLWRARHIPTGRAATFAQI